MIEFKNYDWSDLRSMCPELAAQKIEAHDIFTHDSFASLVNKEMDAGWEFVQICYQNDFMVTTFRIVFKREVMTKIVQTEAQKAIEAQADLRETMEVKELKEENLRLRTKINSLKMEQIHTEAIRVINDAIPVEIKTPFIGIDMVMEILKANHDRAVREITLGGAE